MGKESITSGEFRRRLGDALGSAIRELREEKGLQEEDLAELTEIASSCIQEIEEGLTPSFETLEDVAKALSVPLSQLLERAEQRFSPIGVLRTLQEGREDLESA